MRIAPRHLILSNGLTALACVLHLLVHALDFSVGEWHDYAVYVLVAASLLGSLLHGRQANREALAA
jgi:hypothetical protein